MKKIILVCLLTLPALLSGQDLDFSLSSYPELTGSDSNGNTIRGHLGTTWQGLGFGSYLDVKVVNSATVESIAGADKSLVSSTLSETEYWGIPWEISITPQINLGAGWYLNQVKRRDVGFLKYNFLGNYNNSYELTNDVTSQGPVGFISWAFAQDKEFEGAIQLNAVPVFWTATTQSMEMAPLVAGGATRISGTYLNTPGLMTELKVKVFGLFSTQLGYDAYLSQKDYLDLSPTTLTFVKKLENVSVQSFSWLANLELPLGNLGNIALGAGQRLTWFASDKNGSSNDNKVIFHLSFDLSK